MDQVEVDVIDLQAIDARVEGVPGLLVAVVVVEALRRQEDLAAVQSRRAHRLADGRLVR
jgi:hypothetical protein